MSDFLDNSSRRINPSLLFSTQKVINSGILEYYGIPWGYTWSYSGFQKAGPWGWEERINSIQKRLKRIKQKKLYNQKNFLKRRLKEIEKSLDVALEFTDSYLAISDNYEGTMVTHEIAHYLLASSRQREDPRFRLDPFNRYSNLMEYRTLMLNIIFDETLKISNHESAYLLLVEGYVRFKNSEDPLTREEEHRLKENLRVPFLDSFRSGDKCYWESLAAKKRIEKIYMYLLTYGFLDGPYTRKHPQVAKNLGLFTR